MGKKPNLIRSKKIRFRLDVDEYSTFQPENMHTHSTTSLAYSHCAYIQRFSSHRAHIDPIAQSMQRATVVRNQATVTY